MTDITILYYSASVENPDFEQRIRQNILDHSGNLPIVSVTQAPIPGFGKNISVGKHDNCYANAFRQIQIGLTNIKTKYVLVTEADCLYPPEYFLFRPAQTANFFRFDNVWVHTYQSDTQAPLFYYKGFSDCAQLVNRDFWLEKIDTSLSDRPEWSLAKDPPPPRLNMGTDKNFIWTAKNPVITFKTNSGVSRRTQIQKSISPQDSLPFWGAAAKLRDKMFR